MPLTVYLKKYFKINKQFGSRDRKYITELIVGFYKIGKQKTIASETIQMLAGSFLSGNLPLLFFQKVNNSLAENYHLSFDEKLSFVKKEFNIEIELPFALTDSISKEEYIQYLFSNSNVFIRIRNNKKAIENSLQKNNISFKNISEDCIALPSNTNIAQVLTKVDEYVIQDFSSQMVGEYFHPKPNETWWDCCAASGGKSILLLDKKINIHLLVSDIRESILQNLKTRMSQYHYAQHYNAKVIDMCKPINLLEKYDRIILDAPCSGSGTWGRNAEQFYFFTKEKLKEFQLLQKNILKNALQRLNEQGVLYYITCSIFENENEKIMSGLDKEKYKIVQQKLLNAIEFGGDCIFFAEIKKI